MVLCFMLNSELEAFSNLMMQLKAKSIAQTKVGSLGKPAEVSTDIKVPLSMAYAASFAVNVLGIDRANLQRALTSIACIEKAQLHYSQEYQYLADKSRPQSCFEDNEITPPRIIYNFHTCSSKLYSMLFQHGCQGILSKRVKQLKRGSEKGLWHPILQQL